MEPVLILKTSCVLLALAAIAGVLMAVIRFGGKPHPPSWSAMLHGFIAAAGLTLLAYACATTTVPRLAFAALALFLLAALGGVVLNLRFHLRDVALPIWLMVMHAVVAVLGFLCLLLAAFGA